MSALHTRDRHGHAVAVVAVLELTPLNDADLALEVPRTAHRIPCAADLFLKALVDLTGYDPNIVERTTALSKTRHMS